MSGKAELQRLLDDIKAGVGDPRRNERDAADIAQRALDSCHPRHAPWIPAHAAEELLRYYKRVHLAELATHLKVAA